MKTCYNMTILFKINALDFAGDPRQGSGDRHSLKGREMRPALLMGTLKKIFLTFTHRDACTRENLRVLFAAFLFLVLFLSSVDSHAAGTSVGTVLSNQATAHYTIGANNYSALSNATTFMVDDKVSFTLTANDAGNATIFPNSRSYMTYVVTNTGNGPHDFTLITTATGTNDLMPSAGPTFYSDQLGTSPLPPDANAGGLPYLSNLASDGTATVYLYIAAPATPTDGQSVAYVVTAEAYQSGTSTKSSTQAAADASANKNANAMTRLVVLADGHGNGGDANRDGKYAVITKDGSGNMVGFIVRSATLNVTKAKTVTDQYGGIQPMTGSTIHYMITVTVAGSGTAMNVLITDPIPANTTYTAGTLKLNGITLTDGTGDDAGDVGGTTPATVTVSLGNLTSASPKTITFDVKIN